MNFSHYTSEFATQLSQVSPSSIPGTIWNYYLEYLWFYEANSWVARIAYAFRIIAILVSLPLLILGLLDIASYGVARTLGVIDDVKASTSDKSTVHATSDAPPPTIHLQGLVSPSESTFSDSDRDSFTDHNGHNPLHSSSLSGSFYAGSQTPEFYAGSGEEHNLKLAGVGVFSPAASQPPSPTITRQKLPMEDHLLGKDTLRHRTQPGGKSA